MKKILRLAPALLLVAMFGLFPVEGKAETVGDLSFALRKPYKKQNEGNPLYTQRFGADPGVMEYNGRLYVYMTDDRLELDKDKKIKENTYSTIRTINCISSDDLVNWTDHGRIRVAGSTGIAKWAGNSWAPCAAHKTVDGKEKFFLYFCNGGNGIGVLCADSPTGPWRDELRKPLIDRTVKNCANVPWLFDPAVMVDDDGTGDLAFGGGVPEVKQAAPGTARIVRLGEDMISLDGDPVQVDAPWLFEDSGINRIGDTYVYSYCSNWQTAGNSLRLTDGAIQYMTADNPLGPYTYRGELFPNEGWFFGLYGNNHHSIACLNGEYYLFYHSRPVEKAMKISGNYRSPQIDKITVNADGSLKQVKGTMKGVEQLRPLDPYQPVSACTVSHQAGNSIRGEDGNTFFQTAEGSWTRVSGVDFGEGARQLTVQASSEEGCMLYLTLGDIEQPIAARIEIPAGNEAASFTVPLAAAGIQDIYFVFDGAAMFYTWQAQ